jgi:hypothetical protein
MVTGFGFPPTDGTSPSEKKYTPVMINIDNRCVSDVTFAGFYGYDGVWSI